MFWKWIAPLPFPTMKLDCLCLFFLIFFKLIINEEMKKHLFPFYCLLIKWFSNQVIVYKEVIFIFYHGKIWKSNELKFSNVIWFALQFSCFSFAQICSQVFCLSTYVQNSCIYDIRTPWGHVSGSFSYKKLWFLGLKHINPKSQ